jgi:dimethylaniline monooxygenase (N-oxide forming)
MSTALNMAVIGAGAGGLSAARHLMESGHTVTVYEAGSFVGGLWVYGNDNGLSVAYDSLHINSEPRVTHFRGYPFPDGSPLFPSHREIAAYLNAFADDFGIRERIRFRTRVTCVEAEVGLSNGGWNVHLDTGEVERYDGVVVASGHQGVPAHPEFAKEFAGEYLHSNTYREPGPFQGKRVLVVGVGNSGLDIAGDLALVADRTYSSARSPVLIMPRMILGVPLPRIMSKIVKPYLPWRVQRRLMVMVSQIFHGRMEQWGLRTPTTRTHPASSPTFMQHVAYGKIEIRPGITGVDGTTVHFTDGTSVEVDTMIAATGYELALPFLPENIAPVVERRLEAYKRVVHPDWPGLYFIGFFNVSGGANISMMDVQSEWLAALASGDVKPPAPDVMKAEIRKEQRFLEKSFPGTARYGLELDPVRYRKQIAHELGR